MLSTIGHSARRLVKLLAEKHLSVSVAESCTGGLLGSLLARVPGASAVFYGGFITYTVLVKQKVLGVGADLLEKYGAVSRECACAMAESARARIGASIALSVTGLAGPSGDGSENPIGTVWIAGVCTGVPVFARVHNFSGGRNSIRRKAASAAIDLGLELVNKL
jgi:PncC family amidohydrolase